MAELVEKTPAILMLESAFELVDQRGNHALQNFFLAELSRMDAERAMLKEQAAIIAAQIDQREKALYWRFGKEFEQLVKADVAEQKGDKKSVDYLQGRAGRKIGKESLEVFDEKLAVTWALKIGCIKAIELVVARKTPLMDWAKANGGLPKGCGCVIHPAEDNFFPALPTPRLPAKALAKGLPEE